MKNIIFPILAALFFASCEETIELDLKQTDEIFIIEGLTNARKFRSFLTQCIGQLA